MKLPLRLTAGGLLAIAIATLVAGAPSAQAPTPPLDDKAIEQFLLEAKVVRTRAAGKGITGSLRATLSDGTLTHDAQIQTIDEFKREFHGPKGIERDFRDSWTYNVAAYRVARLMGMDMVPVSVERVWNGQRGAFTWWLDNVLMDEERRVKDNVQPPRPDCWLEQMHIVRMFDALIDNTDRNLGNIIYTKEWRVWAIDHTRAFRRASVPPGVAKLTKIDRGALAGLKALDFEALKREIGRYIPDAEIRLLLSRRDALVTQFTKLGDGAIYDRRNILTCN